MSSPTTVDDDDGDGVDMADSSSGDIVDYCTNAKCFLALFTCGCADNLRQRLCTDSKLSGFDFMMFNWRCDDRKNE